MKNEILDRYNRIVKDCFWEYHFSTKDIEHLFKSAKQREKQFLFEKILLNSHEFLRDMELFDRKDLEVMIENYIVPRFNKEYIYRRKNSIEYYFFNKPLMIDELKWRA